MDNLGKLLLGLAYLTPLGLLFEIGKRSETIDGVRVSTRNKLGDFMEMVFLFFGVVGFFAVLICIQIIPQNPGLGFASLVSAYGLYVFLLVVD